MRARRPPRTALAALVAVAACGTGLYDAAGVPSSGAGVACAGGQIVCGGVCTVESRTQCGAACADCTAAGAPPANGAWACLPGGTCGYECDPGLLKCAGGCCAASALAAGPASTCALLQDGTVRCWGANGSGQLGDGTTVDRPVPVAAPLPSGASALAVGGGHACAVIAGGAVDCWGANGAGQVDGAPAASPALSPAASPVTSGATAVAAGAAHSCALVGGAVKCWGRNDLNQLGGTPSGGVATPVASGASAIAAGSDHTCALVSGAVRCWGASSLGQLGGTPSGGIATPIGSGITLLAAGGDQACASTGLSNGTALDDVVRCWGSGLGAPFGFAVPQPAPAIPLKQAGQATVRFDVSLLAVGRAHACVQRTAELLYCFGSDNTRGQLGAVAVPAGSTEAWPVTGNLAATALCAGSDHACAVAGGRVGCWGANDRGQLGDGSAADPPAGTVVRPSGR